ncbi:hypothetical protein ACFQ7O_22330 [Streptomyces sp. NPDC056485]|uniref:hypothetical protein n=1 Tax=Streptomyces sp. NPDC056485 TaxID=3345834 RepID=UPI0036A9B00F
MNASTVLAGAAVLPVPGPGAAQTVAGGTTDANSHPLVRFDCDTHPSHRWILRRVG